MTPDGKEMRVRKVMLFVRSVVPVRDLDSPPAGAAYFKRGSAGDVPLIRDVNPEICFSIVRVRLPAFHGGTGSMLSSQAARFQPTAFHAKYFAHDLARRAAAGVDRLSMSLFDAAVDLNPHQIEAALFALSSPLSKGVVLADEVGLGKTIEAGLVLCQLWAERRRRMLVICPASLRTQWARELAEKFNIPSAVLDSAAWKQAIRDGRRPLEDGGVVIMSFNYASRMRNELKSVEWDLVAIDEAHKLRNAYRPSNKLGQNIRWATEGRRKLLLTATPLQNSLLELYGLSTLIDENLFGDLDSFRAQYVGQGGDLNELRARLSTFCKRTLRNQVTEYVRYTERRPITRPFRPTEQEQALYERVSALLLRDNGYALPRRQRHLTGLILRKLLASSAAAITATLGSMLERLETLRDAHAPTQADLSELLFSDSERLDDVLDESEEETQDDTAPSAIDHALLAEEIDIVRRLEREARDIRVDSKSHALLQALDIGLAEMASLGAARKALVFTESRRTQAYLREFLESNGYAGKVVLFNGSNASAESAAIYENWLAKNGARRTSSRAVDMREALIDHFRNDATIMLATDAASEGVNLQFCSLVVNYDLPWNPQRVEQRIGRCHRYGQKHDVVVINFMNERNAADQRVLELLGEKFRLFDGVFGASDDVLGAIESGLDFEKRILGIYEKCRTPAEIDAAFDALRGELDEQIQGRLDDTKRTLLDHFDEDVHARLKLQLADARQQLDRVGRRFWSVSRYLLRDHATFDDEAFAFELSDSPVPDAPTGRYRLVSRNGKASDEPARNEHLYRLNHPLGEHVLSRATTLETPYRHLVFDISGHPTRIHAVEELKGHAGHLTLERLTIDAFEKEDHLLFSGFDDDGRSLDPETMEKLWSCRARVEEAVEPPEEFTRRLHDEIERHVAATLNQALERNGRHFAEARDKLEKWADDCVASAEKALVDTRDKIKALRRQSRQTTTLEEQRAVQESTAKLERQLRRQRQDIFNVEDEIAEKRDALIADLERRLAQRSERRSIFTVRWSVR